MEEKGMFQYNLVKRLSFVRWGGTDEELRAAGIIKEEIEKLGGSCEFMEFKIPAYKLHKCTAKITAPFEKELEVVPHGMTGSLPDGGAEFKFMYAERGTADDYIGAGDLSGTAVLINELNFDAYKILCQKKAAAFITISGKYYESSENSDLMPRPLRPKFLENGKIPGFVIRAGDATNIVRNGAEKIRLELSETEGENTSRNILAVIPGTEIKDESVVLTAHYDSVLVGTGSWDNATGTSALMYIYRYFLANPPKRTMRFIWCGSEEQGLYGSKAYAGQKAELLEEIKMCFNFDMCGTVLGPNNIKVTGGEDLKNFVEQFCREVGYSAEIRTGVHSSDSAPFADSGIPGVGISRGTKTAEIHTRNDLMFPICPEQLYNTGEFACKIISRFVNSAVLPVEKKMPDDMREAVDKYFMKDKIPYSQSADGSRL